jgi:hypothetical protein
MLHCWLGTLLARPLGLLHPVPPLLLLLLPASLLPARLLALLLPALLATLCTLLLVLLPAALPAAAAAAAPHLAAPFISVMAAKSSRPELLHMQPLAAADMAHRAPAKSFA